MEALACVHLFADRVEASGTSTTAEYVLTYRLVTGSGWTTRSLDVEVAGDGWARGLALARGTDGTWSAEWTGDEVGGLGLPDDGPSPTPWTATSASAR